VSEALKLKEIYAKLSVHGNMFLSPDYGIINVNNDCNCLIINIAYWSKINEVCRCLSDHYQHKQTSPM